MIASDAIALPEAATGDAKTYLRVGHDGEDALIAGVLKSAVELCEQFTGQVLIAREIRETVPVEAVRAWRRLSRTPVRAVLSVEGIGESGNAAALPVTAYSIDLDTNGDGWIRVTQPGAVRRILVTYEAGMAADWGEVPEALRQGTVRLAAHLYAHRDGASDEGPPAAVTALWRPWRRVRLA